MTDKQRHPGGWSLAIKLGDTPAGRGVLLVGLINKSGGVCRSSGRCRDVPAPQTRSPPGRPAGRLALYAGATAAVRFRALSSPADGPIWLLLLLVLVPVGCPYIPQMAQRQAAARPTTRVAGRDASWVGGWVGGWAGVMN